MSETEQTIIVQVELANGQERLTTWVDKRPDLREGVEITLRGDKMQSDKLWTVLRIYKKEHKASQFEWHRKWTNNI